MAWLLVHKVFITDLSQYQELLPECASQNMFFALTDHFLKQDFLGEGNSMLICMFSDSLHPPRPALWITKFLA
jgi:hypothetical protein